MSVLYVTQPGSEIRKQAARIKVLHGAQTLAAFPTESLEKVVLVGNVHLTTPAARVFLERKIPVLYFNQGGKYLGALLAGGNSVEVLVKTVSYWQNEGKRLQVAKELVTAKLIHQQRILARYSRNHQEESVQKAVGDIERLKNSLATRETIAQVMGVEGAAAASYFSAFGKCIRQDGIEFVDRNRRPPRDPVNGLLSLGYMMLLGEAISAAVAAGLNTGLGFLHEPTDRHPSLALDLLEPVRQPVVDRLTLTLINKRIFTAKDFCRDAEGGCKLLPESLRRYLTYFDKTMSSPLVLTEAAKRYTFRDYLRQMALDLRKAIEQEREFGLRPMKL